jgi:N-acetylneuraminate synthase|tara:strand:+ start:973 stop:2073 length:1101 start_codon:yes stop_codon:yes gene_type:complete
MSRNVFEDLFVLEMTNNHQGNLDRGLEIVRKFSRIVRFNNVRCAIKLQFRDIDSFVHKDFRDREDIYYVRRVLDTKLTKDEYGELVNAIKKSGCIPITTPFDEKSVDLIEYFEMPMIKIASSASNDWQLMERIAKTKKPVIISVGGLSLKDLDDLVTFFENRNIPMAINHCIAAYPTEDHDQQLNQIDYLKLRYPNNVIGLSSHEYGDWHSSLLIAYAKGARIFERHIDIDSDGKKIAKYSSLPYQIDAWFKAWHRAELLCGSAGTSRLLPIKQEDDYLNSYIRGVYAKRNLNEGDMLTDEDIYMAIPLLKGQLSTRELMLGRWGHRVLKEIKKDTPILIDKVDTPYSEDEMLKNIIYERGLEHDY